MKINIFLIMALFLFDLNSQNDNQIIKNHLKELKNITNSADVLFAKILALDLGRSLSSSEITLKNDLILYSSDLRQQIGQITQSFTKDFQVN